MTLTQLQHPFSVSENKLKEQFTFCKEYSATTEADYVFYGQPRVMEKHMGLDFFPAVYSHSKRLGVRSGDVIRLKEGVDAIVIAVAHATNRQTILFVYFPATKTIKRHYFGDIAELLREGTPEEKQESEKAFDSQEETKKPSRKRHRSPPHSSRNTRGTQDSKAECHSCQTLRSENKHLASEKDSLMSKLEKKVHTLTGELQQAKKKKKALQADLKQAETKVTNLEKKEHKSNPSIVPSFTEFRRIYDKLSNLKTAVLNLVDSTLRDIEQEHIEGLFAQKQV